MKFAATRCSHKRQPASQLKNTIGGWVKRWQQPVNNRKWWLKPCRNVCPKIEALEGHICVIVIWILKASPVSRLQSRAWSFACLVGFAQRTKKKERLLLVYGALYHERLKHWTIFCLNNTNTERALWSKQELILSERCFWALRRLEKKQDKRVLSARDGMLLVV